MIWAHEEKKKKWKKKGSGQGRVLRSLGVDLEQSDVDECGF